MSQENNKKESGEFTDIVDLVFRYLKYWKWFVLSVIVCLSIAYYNLRSQDSIYKTVSNILVKPEDSKSGNLSSFAMKSLGLGLSGSEEVVDEIHILSSHTLMRKMILDLELYKSYKQIRFPFDKSYYKNSPVTIDFSKELADTLLNSILFKVAIKNRVAEIKIETGGLKLDGYTISKFPETIQTEFGDFTFNINKAIKPDEEYEFEIYISELNHLAEVYMKSVEVGPASKKANVIELSIMETDVQRGKDILNSLTKLYNADALVDKNIAAQNTVDFINDRIGLISSDLKAVEVEIERYKKENDLINIQVEAEYSFKNMSETQLKAMEYEIQLSLINMITEYLNDSNNKYSLIPLSSSIPEGMNVSMKEYNNALLERTRLLRNTNENSPIIQTLDQQIDMLRKNVEISMQNTKKEISISLQDWNKKQSQIKSRMSDMPRQEREYVEKRRQQELQSEIYILLLQKLQEAELALASNTAKAKIIDAAYVLSKPVGPRGVRILFSGLLIGLFIPILIISVKIVMKRNLSDLTELENATDVPILGEVCKEKSKNRIVVSERATTPIVELFRLIRSNFQFILTQKEEKVILVTSSVSGEGKSFFGINFAISLSLIKNKKVIIVGLDIRNPKLAEYMSIKSSIGITPYLASDEYTPQDIIVDMPEYPNLSIIPAGPIPPNPSELLLSERLDGLFEYLREHFDYIVVDTAPVGMVSDTYSLERISDATIYLFRADYTNKSNLKLIKSVVKEEKLKKVYLVMNGTETKTGYGYGYGAKK